MSGTEELAHGTLVLLGPEEVSKLFKRGEIVLIDIRNPDEYARAHIEGSVSAPLRQFAPKAVMAEAGQKKPVLLCAVGIRSKIAAEHMLEAGISPVAHLEGGLTAWIEMGLPVVAGASPADPGQERKGWFSRLKS